MTLGVDMNNSFYSTEELQKIGFNKLGNDVMISKKASFYGCEFMELGSHVRIDDFCVLSGKILIGNYVHIAVAALIFGGKSGAVISDYCGVSSRSAIYASSDDYSGIAMTNPLIPDEFRNVIDKRVLLEKHSIVGTGSTILPGCKIAEGTAIGSMSLVDKDTSPWSIYVGIPAHLLRQREKRILALEKEFQSSNE